jgi:hypothetical protein
MYGDPRLRSTSRLAALTKDSWPLAMILKAAISGPILAEPDACFVTRIALPFGSTRALPTLSNLDHCGATRECPMDPCQEEIRHD